jgi:hypothetical protein
MGLYYVYDGVLRMVNCSQLKTCGWTCVSGITNRTELLELARSIGRPVRSPSGELVKELTPTQQSKARRGTLSGTYSMGPFPLHTDTAFWPIPSRYIVLRVRGDIRRYTTFLTFVDLFREGPADLCALVDRSVWLVRTPPRIFYCSMKFRSGPAIGWRYDCQCMSPVNDAALRVKELLGPLLTRSRVQCLHWTGDVAVVLSNWDVLHGRGPSPLEEDGRILERVYVE